MYIIWFIPEIAADTGPLITHLTKDYNKLVRPVVYESQAVDVSHEIVPVNVIQFVSNTFYKISYLCNLESLSRHSFSKYIYISVVCCKMRTCYSIIRLNCEN